MTRFHSLFKRRRELAIAAVVGTSALALGGLVAASRHLSLPSESGAAVVGQPSDSSGLSPVLLLVSLPPTERAEQLAELAGGAAIAGAIAGTLSAGGRSDSAGAGGCGVTLARESREGPSGIIGICFREACSSPSVERGHR
ncbi:MAG: hypothetical protein HC881_10095 [Leptolyngbyaceae cyanobacterium SL_7_1]|nr:hypothetical protein [Leptolyngbyaceae cyanobacterium SL_7_1]